MLSIPLDIWACTNTRIIILIIVNIIIMTIIITFDVGSIPSICLELVGGDGQDLYQYIC